MIEIKNLKKEYDGITPINDLSLTINEGDIISIIGPSGTGKSTLLRMINMLEIPTAGSIIVDGEDVTASGYPLNKLREKIGMVFQNFNLFNNMTVIENVCLAPVCIKNAERKDIYSKGMQLLSDVGLSSFAFSYPADLSGGQKQRAAIARTLAMEPEVILLDEPTSALDPTMVGEVESVIKNLADKGYTMMIVTHDMAFAEKISTRVCYLDQSVVYEEGSAADIFKHPAKERTKTFIRRLKELDFRINADSDLPALITELNKFIYKNEISVNEAAKLRAVFEELCFGILLPLLKDNNEAMDIGISYSDLLRTTVVSAPCKDDSVYAKYTSNEIQFSLIEHYAESIKCEDEKIKIKIGD